MLSGPPFEDNLTEKFELFPEISDVTNRLSCPRVKAVVLPFRVFTMKSDIAEATEAQESLAKVHLRSGNRAFLLGFSACCSASLTGGALF